MTESEQKFIVRKCRTIKLNESHRLVATVLVLNSHSRKIHSIFLTTIAAAVRWRYSSFWAWCGSVEVGFLFLSPRRGSFLFYCCGAAAVSFQPWWISLVATYGSHRSWLVGIIFLSCAFANNISQHSIDKYCCFWLRLESNTICRSYFTVLLKNLSIHNTIHVLKKCRYKLECV